MSHDPKQTLKSDKHARLAKCNPNNEKPICRGNSNIKNTQFRILQKSQGTTPENLKQKSPEYQHYKNHHNYKQQQEHIYDPSANANIS